MKQSFFGNNWAVWGSKNSQNNPAKACASQGSKFIVAAEQSYNL
jgi:hypothetical protein